MRNECWIEKNSTGSGRGLIEALSQHLPSRTEEYRENSQDISVPAEIRNKYFQE
jgi:hypothetical protein